MAEYAVTFARSARKELEKLESAIARRILRAIEGLEHSPRPRGCRKLTASESLWRLRVGTYRVVYAIDEEEKTVDIVAVRHRREAYR